MAVAQTSRIELKSPREIDLLRKAGRISAEILLELKSRMRRGMTTQRHGRHGGEDDARARGGSVILELSRVSGDGVHVGE